MDSYQVWLRNKLVSGISVSGSHIYIYIYIYIYIWLMSDPVLSCYVEVNLWLVGVEPKTVIKLYYYIRISLDVTNRKGITRRKHIHTSGNYPLKFNGV
jgi:hypothetical protein